MDMDVQSLAATASHLLASLSQDTRLIELDTALPGALVVERFEGTESVCADFQFAIDCLSTSAFLDAKALIGQPLSLRLRQADGSHLHWHGHCTQVAPLGSDGGLARYRLTMEPWTAFLKLRRNAIICQDLDALGVIERIFDDYPQASYRIDATQSLPVFPTKTQYRVSDHDFVFRLLAEAGLAWRFEHEQGDATDESASCHTLVIFDRDAEIVDAAPAVLRFHRIDATESLDAITHFTDQHQATPNAVTTASWQPERVESHAAALSADPVGPHLPTREVYTAEQSGRFAERRHADLAAELQLDALRLPQRLHMGAGSARSLSAGLAFTLTQHPNHSGERFIPLTVEHIAANNLGSGIVALLDNVELERGSYRNRFVAVSADAPIVPAARPKSTAPGLQTALVVGLPDAAVTSTRDHQVRIQFPWQRGRNPNRGGLTDAGSSANPDGHAPGDDSSGTWVRVSEWQAGPNWGSHALPRIGSEVLVEFQHGDIDQPIIIGQLYNGEVAPPFALAEASNHPGTVSGLHSQSLDGSGTQQWLMDDASGQLRQRLHTSLADSRLELGYLIDPSNASRGGMRGQGFDFATLGWANLRAGQGVLLSTTARPNATSTQLDIAEAVGQLKGAEQTAQALSDAAEGSQVAALGANAQQAKLITALDAEQDGKHPGRVNGQPATKPSGSSRDGGDPVEKFATPLLFVESPDAVALTTPKSALAYAGGNVHLTSQHDAHLAAGHTVAGVSGGHLALFAQHGPIKAIAANGPLTLQAHAGPLELLADQSVTITATDERIDVLAKQKIVLQAGQTQITLEGGDITFACPGNFTVKAGQVPFKGGGKANVALTALPTVLAGGPMLVSATLIETIAAATPPPSARSAPALDSLSTASSTPATAVTTSGDSGRRQFVNFATAEQRWIDGKILNSLERQTQNPTIKVEFKPAGAHTFAICAKPDASNAVYSAGEQGRNANYTCDTSQRSYTTESDGTLVVDDIQIAAAGADEYAFEVMDSRNVVVATERLKTTRRIYVQEIVMKGRVAGCAAENLDAVINEFRNYGIEFIRLPRVEMEAMPNIDLLDGTSGDQARFETLARQAYAASEGPKYEPYTLSVVYTDHLAFRDPLPLPLIEPGEAGPQGRKVRIKTTTQNEAQPRRLWNGFRPGEDWLISAHFVPDGTTARIAIDRSRCRAMSADASRPDESTMIEVDLAGLMPVATRGTIHVFARTVKGWAGGAAIGGTSTNAIAICTRYLWKARPAQDQNRTLIHEIGHKIGMTPGGPTAPVEYDNSKLDRGSKFYYSKGHYGNHCHAGLPQLPSYSGVKGSQCVMYGSSEVTHFCRSCGDGARKADTSQGWGAF